MSASSPAPSDSQASRSGHFIIETNEAPSGAGSELNRRNAKVTKRSGNWRPPAWLVGALYFSSPFLTKSPPPPLIAFDLRQMKGDISVELLEETDPITDQDWQDGITNFVG